MSFDADDVPAFEGLVELQDFARGLVLPRDPLQAELLEAINACAISAKTGEHLNLSPRMLQLCAWQFACRATEAIIMHAENEIENAMGSLRESSYTR